MSVTRRDALRLTAAAAATPLIRVRTAAAEGAAAGQAGAAAPAAGRFLTAAEMALLDELTELVIPADEHSPGARSAGVAAYVDGRLAEYDPEIPDLRAEREQWRAGLAAVEAAARERTGKPFLEASAEERTAVLEALAARESDPRTEAERFFVELKRWTAHAYYTSRIGIHDEMEYKGNTLLQEFVGADPATLPPSKE